MDRDRRHVSATATKMLREKWPSVTLWDPPAQSPDFNPAEQGIGRVRTLARERLVSKHAEQGGLMRPLTREEVSEALRHCWKR
eukprot:gene31013-32834_t